jgi:multidrug resistance efflux pump
MNYEMARNGPRQQEIDGARDELKAAEADYEVAKVTLARVARLAQSGDLSHQDYDNAKASADRASARRDAARERLELLRAGTRQEEVQRAQEQ